jgi:phosphoribosylformylglycinamidine cyclo-ligase
MHAVGPGTKSSLAYMYWKEKQDISVWKRYRSRCFVMNIDDLLCGTTIIFCFLPQSEEIKLDYRRVLSAIINGTEELIKD